MQLDPRPEVRVVGVLLAYQVLLAHASPRSRATSRSSASSSAPASSRRFRMPSRRSISSSTSASVRPAGCGDPAPPLALLLVRRLREPLVVVRRPALVAQRVVGGDHVRLDAREPERHPAGDAGAVAAAGAMDRGRRLGVAERASAPARARRGSGRRARDTPRASTASPRRRRRGRGSIAWRSDGNRQRLELVLRVLPVGPQVDDRARRRSRRAPAGPPRSDRAASRRARRRGTPSRRRRRAAARRGRGR